MKINEFLMFLKKSKDSFLSGKEIWMWWLCYSAFTILVFGLILLLMQFLRITWWVAIIIPLFTGIIWGTTAYYHNNDSKQKKNPINKKTSNEQKEKKPHAE